MPSLLLVLGLLGPLAACRSSGGGGGSSTATWKITLENRAALQLTLRVGRPTATAVPATAGGFDGTDTFTLAAGATSVFNLPCGVALAIVAGGTATNPPESIAPPSDCTAGGTSSNVVLSSPTWEITLENRAALQLTLRVGRPTATAVPATAGGFDGTDTFTLAAGATSVFNLPCGVAFAIVAGGTATNPPEGITPPSDCIAGGTSSNVVLSSPTWEITLENRAALQLTLRVGRPTATAVPATAGGFDGTDTFTLAAGATSVFNLPCGVAFAIVAGGTATNPPEGLTPPSDCIAGGTSSNVVLSSPTWQITLDNSANAVELALRIDDRTEAVMTSPTSYTPATNRFTVAAGGTATASLPCGVAFAIVAGGTATNPPEGLTPPSDCTAGGTSSNVVLSSPTWQITLDNSANAVELALRIDDRTEAVMTSPTSYTPATNRFTVAAGGTATASLPCGVAFAIVAGGTATNPPEGLTPPSDCTAGGTSSNVVLSSPTWQITLDNSANAVELALRIDDRTEAVMTSPTSYTPATNRFTVAAGGTATASLPCGVAFAIVAGGTATNPAAVIQPPQDCTNGGQSKSLAFTSPTWEITLENRHIGQLILQVGPPAAAAVPATAGGFDGTDTFTLAAGATSVFNLPCGVALAISAIGGDTRLTGSIPWPQNCSAGGSIASVPFGAAGITWAVELRNPTAVELILQVSDATEAAFAGTPGGYRADTNRFTLAAGGAATANLPCSGNFEIAAGSTAITNPAVAIEPPQNCTDGGTSATVVLSDDLPPLTAGTISTSFDLAADLGSQLLYYNVATADTRVFVVTSGAGPSGMDVLELSVAAPGGSTFVDTGNHGAGRNAALAFSAPVAGVYAITATNRGSAMTSGLTVTVHTPAPLTIGATAVAMHNTHSCFLLDRNLSCVGSNAHGRLGASGLAADGEVVLLRQISISGVGASAISAGNEHTCAISGGMAAVPSGSAYCWGRGSRGQLGHNTSGSETDSKSAPTQVEGLTSGVTAISTGDAHTCAIHAVGENTAAAKCWGEGVMGQLGHNIGDGRGNKSTPTQVEGLTSGSTAISAGRLHTCAIHAVGGNAAAKCWGWGERGQLGNGGTRTSNSPVQVSGLTSGITAISAGDVHTCAIHVAGGNAAAKCWGWGERGQLGNGGTRTSSSPLQVSGLTSGVSTISAGNEHTCAIHDEDTSSSTNALKVKCWGNGSEGRLGNGITYGAAAPSAGEEPLPAHQSSAPGSNSPVDVRLPKGFGPASLSQGYKAAGICAMSSGGRALCWGRGSIGILGDGSNADRNTPGPVYDSSGF